MKKILAVMAFVATAVATIPAADAVAPTKCTGDLSYVAVAGDVVVPEGATCTFEQAEISGDVTVEPGARLDGSATIGGSVRIGPDGGFNVDDSLIGGDVVCRGCRSFTMRFMYGVGGDVAVTGMTNGHLRWDGVGVAGSIHVTDNVAGDAGSGRFVFIEATAGGNFVVANNLGRAGFYGSHAEGNLQIVGNTGAGEHPVFHVEANSGKNVIFSENVGSSDLSFNYAQKHLQCFGNDPAPTGIYNFGVQSIQGQCEGLTDDHSGP